MCKVMYLPHCFLNLFIGSGLKLHAVYKAILAAVAVDRTPVVCAPLLAWLQVACTHITVNGAPSKASPSAQLPPTALVTDTDLFRHH